MASKIFDPISELNMEHTSEGNPQELVAFLTHCKDYCALIEHASEYSRGEFVRRAYGYLPNIFSYLSQMPAAPTEELEDWLSGYTQIISDETVSYYEEQVRDLLGEELDLFLHYPVGVVQDGELQPERLSRLLLLIYRELGTPLLVLREDAGELLVATLSILQYAFDSYMGDALLSAMRVLHYHKNSEALEEETNC